MLREQLRQTDAYQAQTQKQQPPDETRQVETVEQAVEPVVSLEKGDLEFWMMVVQTLLLWLILRELSRGGGV